MPGGARGATRWALFDMPAALRQAQRASGFLISSAASCASGAEASGIAAARSCSLRVAVVLHAVEQATCQPFSEALHRHVGGVGLDVHGVVRDASPVRR